MKQLLTLILMLTTGLMNVSCQEKSGETMFEYRSLYSPTNADPAFRKEYASHHVDADWDLWGHAMRTIATKHAPDEVYARVDGELHREQYCFSSDKLYKQTVEYILDQFGEGTPDYQARICIMPQDNKVACTCPKCTKAGNTKGNATPAVTAMLRRLAKRFPRHRFFTSAYNSTWQVPQRSLPANVGVLLSASRFQLRVNPTQSKGYDEMRQHIEAWKKVTPNIYVWDYVRNFNDYLTPFPCLHVMQSRLKLYRQMGVRGIFLNGSGYDYAAFDDVQSAVLTQLMANPDLDVDRAVKDYLDAYYPTTSGLIYDYYMTLEKRTVETNHHLPLYDEGMPELVASYLKADEFRQWRQQLDKTSKATAEDERKRLNSLLTALSFTQLRLYAEKCLPLDEDDRTEMIAVLEGHKSLKNMKCYDEEGHTLDDYLKKLTHKE